MIDFGYTVSLPRTIDLDRAEPQLRQQVIAQQPTMRLCIGCGSCTSTCTAGQFEPFSLRQVQHLVRRGAYTEARQTIGRCMLCGKCRMVCPRGVNTRGVLTALLAML